MNNTCPKCGADYNGRPAPNQHDYWCGSTTWGDGDFYQSPECVRRERDQLVERIKRLEEAGDKMAHVLICSAAVRYKTSATASAWREAKEAKP